MKLFFFTTYNDEKFKPGKRKQLLDIRNLFRLEKILKQLIIEYLDILRIFLSTKKKKIIINQ